MLINALELKREWLIFRYIITVKFVLSFYLKYNVKCKKILNPIINVYSLGKMDL